MADDSIYGRLPEQSLIESQLSFLVKYWKNRNLFIKDMRAAQSGLNLIEAPKSAQYMVKLLHTYTLASLINEKTSRYLPRPVIQCLPDDPLNDDSRRISTENEQGLNVCGYELERRGGGDVWDRAVLDSILLDMGVQRIVSSREAYWPEVIKYDRAVAAGERDDKDYELGSEKRKNYKIDRGIPFNKDYVPLEFFYPFYDGKDMPFSFEVEEKTVYSIVNNSTFKNNEMGAKAIKDLNQGPDGGLNTTVNLFHFNNAEMHVYYLGGAGSNSGRNMYPKLTHNSASYTGALIPLYAYEPEIGRSIYNCVSGRYGGWKTDKNRIEAIGKGIMELSQAADEIVSQVLTNIRAKYWPNVVHRLDPEARGFGVGNSHPEAPKIKEGESIVQFVGEEIDLIFKPSDDPMVMWLFDQIQMQISKLGGSSVLFGQRAPGVDTGYNQALQMTQAESLDNKQEQHMQAGAEEEALIISLYAKAIGEPIDMCYVHEEKKTRKKEVKYAVLDPKNLSPMPRFSAQVRKQRPMDYIAALRAFREATDDRDGKGPALSDETGREELLGQTAPDIEYKKILIESQKRELIANGFITDKVGDAINVKLAKHGTPEVSPEMMAKADPALMAAMQQIQPAAAEQGGTDPDLLGQGGGLPMQPGMAPGDPGENNRLGEAVQGAIETGSVSI